jgi:hypothetical protein
MLRTSLISAAVLICEGLAETYRPGMENGGLTHASSAGGPMFKPHA